MRNREFHTIGRLGVNLQTDPTSLEDEELAFGANVWPPKLGTLGTRPSMEHALLLRTAAVALDSHEAAITDILDFVFSSCPGVLLVYVSTKTTYDTGLDNVYARALFVIGTGGNVLAEVALTNACDRPQLYNVGDVTLVLNGTDSLNVASASAAFLYEARKQRGSPAKVGKTSQV